MSDVSDVYAAAMFSLMLPADEVSAKMICFRYAYYDAPLMPLCCQAPASARRDAAVDAALLYVTPRRHRLMRLLMLRYDTPLRRAPMFSPAR